MAGLPFRALMDSGDKVVLKVVECLPEGEKLVLGVVRNNILSLSDDGIIKAALSVGCCLPDSIFMAFCVSWVICAFSCTLRLPNQTEMSYCRMLSAATWLKSSNNFCLTPKIVRL